MRTLSSLLFAVLTSLSAAAYAAPTSEPAAPSGATSQATVATTKVNLNTADVETLKRELSGVGTAKAQAIVAHRDTIGKFTSVDEMLEVTGIGKSLLDRNIEKLTVE